MRKPIRGAMAALLACAALSASEALACDVTGALVCTGTATGVADTTVSLTIGSETYTGTTDGSGNLVPFHVPYAGTYDVAIYLGGVWVSAGTATCGEAGGWVINLGTLPVDAPVCAPPPTADCSPGFYKNHPETWCGACFGGNGCDALLTDLAARGADSSALRDGAKAQIDACFGTAAASPCVDDDR